MKQEYKEPSEEVKNRINHIKKTYNFNGFERRKGFEPALEYIVSLLEGDRVTQRVICEKYKINHNELRICYVSIIVALQLQEQVIEVKNKK
jgi:hypothetical protein